MPRKAPRDEQGQFTRVLYDILKDHIDRRALIEGLVIGEATVAKAFGVSRTPARRALLQLAAEGVLHVHGGRGFLVRYDSRSVAPVRTDILQAGLVIPEANRGDLGFRGWGERIYPEVEREVVACSAFGRFLIKQTSLAQHYDVSRTVAHEILTRLERTGLVCQDRHARWYVLRLTSEKAKEHYQIRQVLEPLALTMAAPFLDPKQVEENWQHLVDILSGKTAFNALGMDQIERHLHFDIVHCCPNEQLVKVIKESQLPLISTAYTFERYPETEEVRNSVIQHLSVFNALMSGQIDLAADALTQHLKIAAEVNVARIGRLPPLPRSRLPAYLVPVED